VNELAGALAAALFVIVEFGGFLMGPVVVVLGFLVDLTLAILGVERPLSAAGAAMNGILVAWGAFTLVEAFYGAPIGESNWRAMLLLVLVLIAIPVNLVLWIVIASRAARTRRRRAIETIPAVDV
jgi:hypothetical protein